MVYNLSNASVNYDFVSFTKEINSQTDGTLIFGFLLSIFFLFFIGFKLRFDAGRSLTGSSFITALISIIFSIAGFVQVYIPIIFVLLFAGGIVMLKLESG